MNTDDELEIDATEADAPLAAGPVEIVVLKNFTDPRRLDQYVCARLQTLSRATVQRLLLEHQILLNGAKTKASHKVRAGDRIEILQTSILDDRPAAEPIPLNLLYEDESMVIVNKPPAMIVHPGRGKDNKTGTLTNALQHHFDSLSTIGGDSRPGIVHRLDRDTSGVILIAKTDQAHARLALQFEQRKVSKEYLAICYGQPDRDRDSIDRRIGKHPTIREKMAIREDAEEGRPANTFYEVAERFAGYSLICCRPLTGRTHQIRVHLEWIKCPVVADKAYAGRSVLHLGDLTGDAENEDVLIARQALHAHKIRFRHPDTREWMEAVAPLPADMALTLEALRQHRMMR